MKHSDTINIKTGDITRETIGAIVNAANESLLGGGGVDGAIHHAAGPGLLEACRLLHGCPTGEARLTRGFNLPADYVIHTVGPVWHGGTSTEDSLLASCYKQSLALAASHGISSIAFPAISTGVYRFPLERATRIALTETNQFLADSDVIQKVVFVCFDTATTAVYKKIFSNLQVVHNKPV